MYINGQVNMFLMTMTVTFVLLTASVQPDDVLNDEKDISAADTVYNDTLDFNQTFLTETIENLKENISFLNKTVQTDEFETDNSTTDDVDSSNITEQAELMINLNATDSVIIDYDSTLNVSNENSTKTDESQERITSTTTPSPTINYVDPREWETHKDIYSNNSNDCKNKKCELLPMECLDCTYNYSCSYGLAVKVNCTSLVSCEGPKTMQKNMTCQYCFQTRFGEEHICGLGPQWAQNEHKNPCKVKKSPIQRFNTTCSVRSHVLCLGRRTFPKMLPCNWTSGYRWTTTLILSVFLGGFGADRFYLGQWREGIGKLFSFGGLGVWTVIDVILISIGYISPEDGSLFIY